MTVYLCGPIEGCSDAESKDWREAAKKVLPDTLDPMRRDFRGRTDDCSNEIVTKDKLDIMASQALLVNYIRPTVGTMMEVIFAWEQHKYVVVVAAKGTRISPWLKYHASIIVNTFEEAYELLK